MNNIPALPCVRCDKQLTNVFELAENQPYGGTVFKSYGQYGSTAYDPMGHEFIELNLCDDCVREVAAKGYILEGKPVRTPAKINYETWRS